MSGRSSKLASHAALQRGECCADAHARDVPLFGVKRRKRTDACTLGDACFCKKRSFWPIEDVSVFLACARHERVREPKTNR